MKETGEAMMCIKTYSIVINISGGSNITVTIEAIYRQPKVYKP
jgi:hypothetical protein